MGARLVLQAATYALPKIPQRHHASRTVLLVMALHAKDTDQSPRYTMGSAHLERALGYPIAPDNDTGAGAKAVSRAIAELESLGYIEKVRGLPNRWKRQRILTLPGHLVRDAAGTSHDERGEP